MMSEDHLDPDIHLWPETCPECEKMANIIESAVKMLENGQMNSGAIRILKEAIENKQ